MLEGIDVSKWNSTWDSNGLSFIILRASIATTKDTLYDAHYEKARKAGLVTMAYHYGYADNEASLTDQVALFLNVAKDADFLWLDQERSGFNDVEAQHFIDLVHESGRLCGLYHSVCGFGGVKADAKWVADWREGSITAGYPRTCDGSKEFPGWDIWQYEGSGDDKIDNDYSNPNRPLTEILRRGYITKVECNTIVTKAVEDSTAPLIEEINKLTVEVSDLEKQVEGLSHKLQLAQATVDDYVKKVGALKKAWNDLLG